VVDIPLQLAVVKFGSMYDDISNTFYLLAINTITGFQVFGSINISNPSPVLNVISNTAYIYDFFVDRVTVAPVPSKNHFFFLVIYIFLFV